jgi:hypothetical protein
MSKRLYKTAEATIAAGAGVTLPAGGEFVACIAATLPEFHLGLDGDEAESFAQGFELRVPGGFNEIRLENHNSVPVTVTIAWGRGELVDRRLLTSDPAGLDPVTLADIQAKAFRIARGTSAVSGQYSLVQLLNPAASGKLSIIRAVSVSGTVAGGIIGVPYDTPLLNDVDRPVSNYAGAAAGITEFRRENNATIIPGPGSVTTPWFNVLVPANTDTVVALASPVVLPAGKGLVVYHSVVNVQMQFSADIIEVPG